MPAINAKNRDEIVPQLRIQVKKWMQAMLTFSTDCFVGKNGKRMHILVVAPEGKLRNNRLHSAIASVKKSAAETGTGIDVHFCSSEDFVMGELFSKFPEAIGYTSARSGKTAAEIFGFKPSLLIEYSLSPLSQSEKTIFGYALKGRGGSRGLLGRVSGYAVGRNVVVVPRNSADELSEFFEFWRVKHGISEIFQAAARNRQKSQNNGSYGLKRLSKTRIINQHKWE